MQGTSQTALKGLQHTIGQAWNRMYLRQRLQEGKGLPHLRASQCHLCP